MRSTRILAGLSAAAFAASMMSMVSASAAEEVAGTGACTVVVGDDYKGEEDITLDLLDDVDPADVVAIHFTAQEEGKEFQVAFNGKEVTDHDEATGEDSYVTVTDPDTDITIDADDVNWDDLYFSVRYTSETVGDEVTVDWEVLVDGEVTDSTDPEDSSSEVERRGAIDLDINQGISYMDNFAFSHENAIEEGGNHNYVGIGFEFSPRLDTTQAAYWTGECSYVMIITYNNGTVNCKAYVGPDYEGDMELSAERFEELDEDVIIDSADFFILEGENDEWAVATGFGFENVEMVNIYAMDWSETEESANTPYINVDKIHLTYIDTGAPEESSSSESSSETPSSSEAASSVASSSEASSSSSSTVDNNSSSSTASSSSTGSSSAAGGNNSGGAANGDNNPTTGAAALGALGVVLAGAAMVVSKKND